MARVKTPKDFVTFNALIFAHCAMILARKESKALPRSFVVITSAQQQVRSA